MISLPDHSDPESALPDITTVEKKSAPSPDGGPFRFLQRPKDFRERDPGSGAGGR